MEASKHESPQIALLLIAMVGQETADDEEAADIHDGVQDGILATGQRKGMVDEDAERKEIPHQRKAIIIKTAG